MKFGKRFEMTVQVDDLGNAVTIQSPITLVFDVQRNIFAGANTGRFTLYNLAEETRNKIFHDRYDTMVYRQVILRAGYESQNPLPIVFQGNIQVAYSRKQHADWITEINAFDGYFGMMNGQSATTFPAGSNLRDILGSLISAIPNVIKGAVGGFSGSNDRGVSYMGNTWDIVSNIAANNGGVAFVDNEQANVLLPNEYIRSLTEITAPLITGDTGLLKAQMLFKNRLDVDVLFDPIRKIGQLVTVRSEEPKNDGDYIIKGISHRGTISGAIDSPTVTTLNLDKGTSIPVGVS